MDSMVVLLGGIRVCEYFRPEKHNLLLGSLQ